MNTKLYRPNVAVFVQDESAKILFCKRRDNGNFQIPQGGIETGETPEQALARELLEETGIKSFQVINKTHEPICYDWPTKFRPKNSLYIGQEQTYFLVSINEQEKGELISTNDFSDYEWHDFAHIVSNTIEHMVGPLTKAWELLN